MICRFDRQHAQPATALVSPSQTLVPSPQLDSFRASKQTPITSQYRISSVCPSAASQPFCHQSLCFRVLSWNRFCHPDFHHRPSRALNADLSENYELVRSFRKLLLGGDPATIARILPKLRKRRTQLL